MTFTNTRPAGVQAALKHPAGTLSRFLKQRRKALRLSHVAVADRMNCGTFSISTMEQYEPPPNHPLLTPLADLYDEPYDKLRELSESPSLSPQELQWLTRVQESARERKAAKQHLATPTASAPVKFVADSSPTVEPTVKQRSTLTRKDQTERQIFRAVITTLNLAVMEGEKTIEQIPVEHLMILMRRLMTDAYHLNPHDLLLSENFAKVFDR